jgi:hypothetical protein
VLERGIVADVALVHGHTGDQFGNLTYRYAARNFNPLVATAGRSPSPRSRSSPTSRYRGCPGPTGRSWPRWPGCYPRPAPPAALGRLPADPAALPRSPGPAALDLSTPGSRAAPDRAGYAGRWCWRWRETTQAGDTGASTATGSTHWCNRRARPDPADRVHYPRPLCRSNPSSATSPNAACSREVVPAA